MSILDDFKSVEARHKTDIEECERTLQLAREASEKAEHDLCKAEEKYEDTKASKYRDLEAAARKYIDAAVAAIPDPDKWDEDRVAELRKVLATHADATLDDRLVLLQALAELQKYVMKFPLVKRVAEVLREWTGHSLLVELKKFNDRDTYPTEYELRMKSNRLLWTMENLPQEHDHAPFMPMPRIKPPAAHKVTFGYRGWNDSYDYAKFWEIECAALNLDPKFLARNIPDGYDGFTYNEYLDALRDVGRRLCVVNSYTFTTCLIPFADQDGYQYPFTLAQEVASRVVSYGKDLFPLKAVRAGFPYADRYTRDFVEGTVSTAISKLERDLALAHIDKITFDFDTFDLCWTYKQDGDPMFDPDTCEMVHRSTVIHRCSMLDTTLDRFVNSARNDILEYDSIMELPTT